jgi:hypothetical protein
MVRPLPPLVTTAAAALAVVAAVAAGCGGSATPTAPQVMQPIPQYAVPSCPHDPWPLATTLLVGFSGGDSTAAKPGFHLRYQYLAGAAAPDADCLSSARAKAAGCGASWWGTWQYDQDPPGAFVRGFVATAKTHHLLPMLTYYMLLPASGVREGAPEVTQAARDPFFLRRYLNDFRFFLLQLGCDRALVHVEPDFWGYAQHVAAGLGGDASALPAAVKAANPLDCADQPDTVAGLGRCMVAMARRWAPNAKIGLHASGWATGYDCILNTDAGLDVAARGAQTGAFLDPAGAASSDFVAVDIADRDAGWRQASGYGAGYWIHASGALPTYAQAFSWSRAVAQATGKPLVWWQIPVGNMAQPNTYQHWQDDKVAYFFDHPDLVVASGAVAMAFGSGETAQTTPETDGDELASRAAALLGAGGRPLP